MSVVVISQPVVILASTWPVQSSVPTEIAPVVDQPPVQPRLQFPTTVVGMKKRSFNLDWYRLYHWLEYSRERDAA